MPASSTLRRRMFRPVLVLSGALAALSFGLFLAPGRADAQTSAAHPVPPVGGAPASDASSPQTAESGNPAALFPHSEDSRFWISGQANVIMQWHPAFPAEYSGPDSLTAWEQSATTHVLTLYTGYQLTHSTEVFADLEDATGDGIGNANGLAGYTNLDSVRLVQGMALSRAPYLARLMVRQVIPLSKERVTASRDALNLATSVPVRRIEFRMGKFDLADFFDTNTWGSDSHLQFMNWTVDNNGAYDYAANTRGYTDGAMVEYDDRRWSARFAEVLMPKSANGTYLDADVARARAENLEIDVQGNRIARRPGAVRLLGYVNHADMGSYEEAIAEFLDHRTVAPDIIATRRQGRHRYGFGLNFEQAVTSYVGAFGRLGWSDGRNESYCYTEDDRTLELGGFAAGRGWKRLEDRAGVAFVMNGIVAAHQRYLALGGLGFLLGDGGLTYGHEKIVEGFYTAHLWRGFYVSYDFQSIHDPGYNQARGPVAVSSLRFHTEF
jgi:high affinity Mn2+ porin